jgi:hypothetical protein
LCRKSGEAWQQLNEIFDILNINGEPHDGTGTLPAVSQAGQGLEVCLRNAQFEYRSKDPKVRVRWLDCSSDSPALD